MLVGDSIFVVESERAWSFVLTEAYEIYDSIFHIGAIKQLYWIFLSNDLLHLLQ